MATQGSPDLQESTPKQNSAVCITGVNKIAPNFITLVATYIYVVRHSATYIYVVRRLMVKEQSELYILQDYGCCPQHKSTCVFKLCFTVNDLLHTSHVYGRSPLCMRRCLFRSLCTLNDLLQIPQVYGRSPLCMR